MLCPAFTVGPLSLASSTLVRVLSTAHGSSMVTFGALPNSPDTLISSRSLDGLTGLADLLGLALGDGVGVDDAAADGDAVATSPGSSLPQAPSNREALSPRTITATA